MSKVKSFLGFIGRKISGFYNAHPVVTCLLGGLLITVYSEIFARQSPSKCFDFIINSPLVFVLNVLIVTGTLAISLVIKRGIALYTTVFVLWLGFSTANGVILLNRPAPFTFSDFMILPSVLDIITVYLNIFSIIIIVLAIAGAIFGLVMLWKHSPKRKVDKGVDLPSFFIIALLVIFVIPVGIMSGSLTHDYSDICQGYLDHGFVYSFSRSIVFHGIREPQGYDGQDVETILSDIEASRDLEGREEPEVLPNVIFVQLESFFDVKAVKGVSFSEDPIPNFTALKQSRPSGYLSVPFIGSGTANTEFEILTGMNIEYFVPGEYPYIMVMRDNVCESIPYLLKKRGYTSHTMHNNTGTFYSRHEVYPNLGFDTFIPLEFMYGVEYNELGWAKDKVLISEIDKCLTSTEGRDFVFTVAVQPHGAYTTEETEGRISVSGLDDPELSNMYKYYANQLYESDAFIGELIEKYEDHSEPTVIVFYGDHLPDLKLTEQDLKSGNMYQTEYVIWSNYGMEESKASPDLQAYQFSSYLFGLLGINDGIMNGVHRYFSESEDYRRRLEVLEYDALYGEKFSYKDKNYSCADMKFGNSEIIVDKYMLIDRNLAVNGRNFNEFSVVYINGKRYDTVFVKEMGTLVAQNVRLSEAEIYHVAVAQEAEDGTVFSFSEAER